MLGVSLGTSGFGEFGVGRRNLNRLTGTCNWPLLGIRNGKTAWAWFNTPVRPFTLTNPPPPLPPPPKLMTQNTNTKQKAVSWQACWQTASENGTFWPAPSSCTLSGVSLPVCVYVCGVLHWSFFCQLEERWPVQAPISRSNRVFLSPQTRHRKSTINTTNSARSVLWRLSIRARRRGARRRRGVEHRCVLPLLSTKRS
jgi:hypothetical protein